MSQKFPTYWLMFIFVTIIPCPEVTVINLNISSCLCYDFCVFFVEKPHSWTVWIRKVSLLVNCISGEK
jgi:hypothetical protein